MEMLAQVPFPVPASTPTARESETQSEGSRSPARRSRANKENGANSREPKARSARMMPSFALTGPLRMTGDKFDAQRELPRILEAIGLPSNSPASVEMMTGFSGGLNDGVWFLTLQGSANVGGANELVLKLVPSRRKYPTLPTEVENSVRLSRSYPNIRTDPGVAFPVKMLDCMPKKGQQMQNLIIMPKAPGQRLGDWLGLSWARGHHDAIAYAMELLGRDLRAFNARYGGQQHADFQPSNIYYNEADSAFVYIDIGGIGTAVGEQDNVHFTKALEICGKAYGEQFVSMTKEAFNAGFNEK
jgi:hypothetical protein